MFTKTLILLALFGLYAYALNCRQWAVDEYTDGLKSIFPENGNYMICRHRVSCLDNADRTRRIATERARAVGRILPRSLYILTKGEARALTRSNIKEALAAIRKRRGVIDYKAFWRVFETSFFQLFSPDLVPGLDPKYYDWISRELEFLAQNLYVMFQTEATPITRILLANTLMNRGDSSAFKTGSQIFLRKAYIETGKRLALWQLSRVRSERMFAKFVRVLTCGHEKAVRLPEHKKTVLVLVLREAVSGKILSPDTSDPKARLQILLSDNPIALELLKTI